MTGSFYWSASAGRWAGVPVRVHVLLFMFIAVIFGVEWNYLTFNHGLINGTAVCTSLILIASLILHELAHVFAIQNLGGHVNNIVLTPWGGNSDFALPATLRDRSIVHLAGPFANLVIAAMCAMVLIQSDTGVSLGVLLNPLEPHLVRQTAWELSFLKIAAWINFQLFLVNLIPCFPFDGGGVLRSLVSWLNPRVPRARMETTIMVIGHAVGLTLIGLGWVLRDYDTGPIRPAWLLLLMSGIGIVFSARFSFYTETVNTDDEWDHLDELEYESLYDENSFYEFPEDENDGHSQWLSEKQQARKREEERREREEDHRADVILERVHNDGIGTLTEEEKLLLQRVSARLRQRREVSGSLKSE